MVAPRSALTLPHPRRPTLLPRGAHYRVAGTLTCERWCAQRHRRSPYEVSGWSNAGRRPYYGENHMLFTVGVLIALIAVVIVSRMRVPGGVNAAKLGSMSERWLAEHRASHLP